LVSKKNERFFLVAPKPFPILGIFGPDQGAAKGTDEKPLSSVPARWSGKHREGMLAHQEKTLFSYANFTRRIAKAKLR
jgi:hypothetical protein